MPYSEDQIRKLIADGRIRLSGRNTVTTDLPGPQGYNGPEHRKHIDMLRAAYMLAPRDSYDVPEEPYVDGYASGGSGKRWLDFEMATDRNGKELDELRRTGQSLSRMYRNAMGQGVMGDHRYTARPDEAQYQEWLGLRQNL